MKNASLWLALSAAFVACSNGGGGGAAHDAAADADVVHDAAAEGLRDAAVDASAGDAPDATADAPAADTDDAAASDGAVGADAPAGARVDLRFSGHFPVKVLAHGRRLLVLLDKPVPLRTEFGQPSRSVRWIDRDGTVIRSRGSSGGMYLLDAAVHPSGQTTLLFAERTGFVLARTDGDGNFLGSHVIADPLIDADRPASPPANGPIEPTTFDVGRIASIDEDIMVATRTGRHSVVAYRFAYAEGDSFPLRFRTLVAPPLSIPAIGLTGGSYDTFGLVGAQFAVHVAAGPEGTAYVGVRYPELVAPRFVRVHEEIFGEKLVGDADALDSYVTRLSPRGDRLGTSVVSTDGPDELQGLRAVAGAVWVSGRTETWNAQGTGHDAFVARVDGTTGAVALQRLDVDRGDIAFDVLPRADGSLLVAGSSGYVQNPHGASVSYTSRAFVRGIPALGMAGTLPSSQRRDEARTFAPLPEGELLVGGMLDGPGTHTADSDLSLLRADGFLVSWR